MSKLKKGCFILCVVVALAIIILFFINSGPMNLNFYIGCSFVWLSAIASCSCYFMLHDNKNAKNILSLSIIYTMFCICLNIISIKMFSTDILLLTNTVLIGVYLIIVYILRGKEA